MIFGYSSCAYPNERSHACRLYIYIQTRIAPYMHEVCMGQVDAADGWMLRKRRIRIKETRDE